MAMMPSLLGVEEEVGVVNADENCSFGDKLRVATAPAVEEEEEG